MHVAIWDGRFKLAQALNKLHNCGIDLICIARSLGDDARANILQTAMKILLLQSDTRAIDALNGSGTSLSIT